MAKMLMLSSGRWIDICSSTEEQRNKSLYLLPAGLKLWGLMIWQYATVMRG
jgi:hypothetical protein